MIVRRVNPNDVRKLWMMFRRCLGGKSNRNCSQKKLVPLITFFGELAKAEMSSEMSTEVGREPEERSGEMEGLPGVGNQSPGTKEANH